MDDRRFDALARSLAAGRSRRAVLKGMLGLGGAAVAGAAAYDRADAARRGYSGPPVPTSCIPQCDGTTCGPNGCGGICSCARGLACEPELGALCFVFCDGAGSCAGDCHCDPLNLVCASNQSVSSCSRQGDCPAGTYCEDFGSSEASCVAPCIVS